MQNRKGIKRFKYKFEDYILTPDNQLIFHTTFIRTGAKELAVLRVLIESAGILKTKDELLDEVWGTTFVSEESLARCVYILRKIFKKNNHQALIQTVYSKGYIFVGEVTKILPPENPVNEVEIVEPLSSPTITSAPIIKEKVAQSSSPPQNSTFQEMLESLLGNKFSLLEVLGQKHIAIEIKISLPAPEILGKNTEN